MFSIEMLHYQNAGVIRDIEENKLYEIPVKCLRVNLETGVASLPSESPLGGKAYIYFVS